MNTYEENNENNRELEKDCMELMHKMQENGESVSGVCDELFKRNGEQTWQQKLGF